LEVAGLHRGVYLLLKTEIASLVLKNVPRRNPVTCYFLEVLKVDEFVEKVLNTNPWLSGEAEAMDGDPFAGLEHREMLENVNDLPLEEIYESVKNGYVGTFRWEDVYFFNHPVYGCFVYSRKHGHESYIEHLSIYEMKFEEFEELIRRVSK